ncbi:sigma-54 dependent transcriptional regulator [Bacteroides fragilis]|nr:sigma-54 dependent transcriptional regulator [Bacteroides fragilis]
MKRKILIVEDNVGLSQIQKDWFDQAGYDAITAMNEPVARALVRKNKFDLILSDVRLPEGDGISLLKWLKKEKVDIPFIITTEYVSVPDVVRTIKLGARDYLPKPVHREHLLELAEEIFRPLATVRMKRKDLFRRTSSRILEVEKFARLVAPSDMSVLILGANGTGKESVAQSIHENSGRAGMPFVAVNYSILPRELAPSMLFGHEKGAFTGADAARPGFFDMAKGGTLFLDEIGTMSFEIQSMLLRVLQENIYMPIGGQKEKFTDVRVVAATNENMERAIKEGKFREDLYHRLCEFEIRQPSLAECPEDIIPLAEFFRERFSKELKRDTQGFTEDTRRRMLAYRWPGNVRELQNRVKRAVLLSESPMLDVDGLEVVSRVCGNEEAATPAILPLKGEAFEKESIARALKACNGHREQTAGMLNINPATLYRKMKKYGLK